MRKTPRDLLHPILPITPICPSKKKGARKGLRGDLRKRLRLTVVAFEITAVHLPQLGCALILKIINNLYLQFSRNPIHYQTKSSVDRFL
jgi:hypothetical protein